MPNSLTNLGSNVAKVALVAAASYCVEKGVEYCIERVRQRQQANAESSLNLAPAGLPGSENLRPTITTQISSTVPLNISEELTKSREKRQAADGVEGTTQSSTSLSDFGDDEIKHCLSILTETEFLQLLIACGMQTQAPLIPLLPGAIKRCVVRHFAAYPRGTTKLSNVELHHLKQAMKVICTNIGTDILNIVQERDPALNRNYPLGHIIFEVEKSLSTGTSITASSNVGLPAINSTSKLVSPAFEVVGNNKSPIVTANSSLITNPTSGNAPANPNASQEALLSQVLIICIAYCQDFLWKCGTTIFDTSDEDGDGDIDEEMYKMLTEFELAVDVKLRETCQKCGGWNKLSNSSLTYSAIAGGVVGGVLLAFQGLRTLRGGALLI